MYVEILFPILNVTIMFLIFMQSGVTQDKSEMEKLSWILDKWVSRSGEAESFETWSKTSDDLYEGYASTVKDNVTTFEEKLKIQKTNSGIFYIADVKHNPSAVSFRLASVTDKEVTFSNPEHDFPQKITYKNEEGNLHAWIEGPDRNGETVKIDFYFQKMR